MPASFLISLFLAFIAGAALVPTMKLIKKRKNPRDTTAPAIVSGEIQENNNGKPGNTFSDHPVSMADRSHLESVVRAISTPLNTMIGNMELIEQANFSEEQKNRWKAVRLASDSLLKKVSDTLEYCSLENHSLPVEHMDFDACEMAARSISPLIGKARSKNTSIHLRCAQFPLLLRNDQIRIAQILGHLLENSIQFTHEGSIMVRLECEMTDPDHQLLRMVVEDNGAGIPAELHEKIFNPFMSSTGRDDNIGLGLAICRRLCNRLNADISMASTADSGSRFTVEFPCRPIAAHGGHILHRNALKGMSTLFICAAKEWHDSIIPHLRHWGLEVEAYHDPAQVDRSRAKTASCVVLFGASCQWSATAENEIIAEAAYIIEGNEENALELKKAGRTLLVSCYSLSSLFKAFEQVASSVPSGTEPSSLLPPYPSTLPPAHVVEAFKNSLQSSLRNIQLAIACENGVMVVQELHNLSGSLAVLHSPEFSRTCIALENRIKMEGLPSVIPGLEELMQLLKSHLEGNMFSMRF